MTQSECFFLADISQVDHVGDLPHNLQQVGLLFLLQNSFQLETSIEVVFNRGLAAASDHNDLVATRSQRLFYAVLDDWFIDQRKHFLGLRLGGGKKTRAQSRSWKYRFANFHGANSLSRCSTQKNRKRWMQLRRMHAAPTS